MIDETNHIVLEHLRYIRAVVDETRLDVKNLTLRMGLIEHHIGAFQLSEAGQNSEIDRIKLRLDRIEKRLELAD